MNRNLLAWATFVSMLISIYLIFMYAPTEATMGEVQRIFYFHVSLAWISFLAIFVVFIYSVRFLVSRDRNSTPRRLGRRSRRASSVPQCSLASALGQASMGHLVDLGRPSDLGLCPVADLHGISGAEAPGRVAGATSPSVGRVWSTWRCRCADCLHVQPLVANPASTAGDRRG